MENFWSALPNLWFAIGFWLGTVFCVAEKDAGLSTCGRLSLLNLKRAEAQNPGGVAHLS